MNSKFAKATNAQELQVLLQQLSEDELLELNWSDLPLFVDFYNDDGGRRAAGYRGTCGDCACRALAIALDQPYPELYQRISAGNKQFYLATGTFYKGRRYTARHGCRSEVWASILASHGWTSLPQDYTWETLPPTCLVQCAKSARKNASRHVAAVVQGTLRDSWNSRRTAPIIYQVWVPGGQC